MQIRSTVLAVVALATAACGGSDSDSTTATTISTTTIPTTTTSAPAVTAAAPPSASARCRPADVEAASMADGMKDGAALRKPFAVPLDPPIGNYRSVVAAEVDGGGAPAGDGQVGAWGTGAGAGSPVSALDDTAQRYSTWGEEASEGSPADRMRDQVAARPEVAAAKACVTG